MAPDIEREGGGNDPWVDRLSEYLDGELTQAEREALETHLVSCDACAETLDDLREVVSRAHALEDAPPAEDLWPGIESRIAGRAPARLVAREGARSIATAPLWWARRFELGVPQLAAAAVLLVALSAGAMWLAMRGTTLVSAPNLTPSQTPVAVASAPATAPGVDAVVDATPALAVPENAGYDASIASLEQALAEGRGRLDPKTLRVIEQNLKIIDHALTEARGAVAADPNNSWLRSHLAATMKRKVDLLRTATLLTAARG
jgi:anti-sigma factor RsiW